MGAVPRWIILLVVIGHVLDERVLVRREVGAPCSEQKIAQFRTHDLTKELSYVSTQQSGQLDTFLLNHFSVY